MNEIVECLLFRLSGKGVIPSHVPGLLRDVQNLAEGNGHFTVDSVNRSLESLGWGEEILDEAIFALIQSLSERPLNP